MCAVRGFATGMFPSFDIHDRVNYSVEQSSLKTDVESRTFTLVLTVDTGVSRSPITLKFFWSG